jgi:hypothetical protein
MAMRSFDDPRVRAAMRAYLAAADRLDQVAADGAEARDVVDLAEAKTLSGMALRRELTGNGWRPPARSPEGEPLPSTH